MASLGKRIDAMIHVVVRAEDHVRYDCGDYVCLDGETVDETHDLCPSRHHTCPTRELRASIIEYRKLP